MAGPAVRRLAIVKFHVALGYSVIGIAGMGLVISKTLKDVLIDTGDT